MGLCGSKKQPKTTTAATDAEGNGAKTLLSSEAMEAQKPEEPQTHSVVEDVKEKIEEVAEKVTETMQEVKEAVFGGGEEAAGDAKEQPVKENETVETTKQTPVDAVIEQTSAPKAALCC